MLETLEKSNIKKMSVEEPEKKDTNFGFEITEKDIVGMDNYLKNLIGTSKWYTFINLDRAMRNLRIVPSFNDMEVIDWMEREFENSRILNYPSPLVMCARFLKDFGFPRDFRKMDILAIKQEFRKTHKDKDWHYFTRLAADIRELNLPISYSITPQDIEEIKAWIQFNCGVEEPHVFAILLQDLDALNIEVTVTEEDIKSMIFSLKEYRKTNDWYYFGVVASFINNFLKSNKLSDPVNLENSTPPIPEQKKF